MMISFGTKAETLDRASSRLKHAKVLPQVRLSVEHCHDNQKVLTKVQENRWLDQSLIVRSSAQSEDNAKQSFAGHFSSVLDVKGPNEILTAIRKVMASFESGRTDDQIFIQPMLKSVTMSGVAFSKNPSSGVPYILINYDEVSGTTDSVTSGITNDLKSYCHYRFAKTLPPSPFDQIGQLIFELEKLFDHDSLDIEFAFAHDVLFLLQVRPLVLSSHQNPVELIRPLDDIHRKLKQSMGPHPFLHGSRTIYGVMPDWNPAEIIGIRPRPLALSLYKEIVTDHIWAYQRDNYGYCNLRSFPLLVNFHGLPYIDIRVSFNSFIPSEVDHALAAKLVDYYLSRLEEYPNFHDKVEFEIIYSCYTLDLPQRLESLKEYGFDSNELSSLAHHLRHLTNRIIDGDKGLWKEDIEKINILKKRYDTVLNSSLDPISKIYWLLEDCKRYGTLPFAGLARAGFIAIQLLKSLVHVGILTHQEYHQFLESLETVSSKMSYDLSHLDKEIFLDKYGHLRPGTYDLLSPRYDEAPDQYFSWKDIGKSSATRSSNFLLSLNQIKKIETLLKEHDLVHNSISFFDFIKAAIEGREYAKFIFSRNLSQTLSLIKQLGEDIGLSQEECSFLNISSIKSLYSSSEDIQSVLRKSIVDGKESFQITESLILPSLITNPEQVYSFSLPPTEPNYITMKTAKGMTSKPNDRKDKLNDSILLIPRADPGYDWIFSHHIAGFITMFGGMNSHMAIRASELNIPAVIGAGETLFHKWEKAKILEIDCSNRQVRILQ